MKNLLKVEEAAMFAFAVYLFTLLHFAWWWFAVLLLLPDVGMLGYLHSNKTGAFTYNLFHHKGVAILFYFCGIFTDSATLMLLGIILLAHSSLDRVFGYGLKYAASFHHTHLGMIGNNRK